MLYMCANERTGREREDERTNEGMNEVTQSCIVPPNSEREKALDSTRSLDGKNDARAGERASERMAAA